MSEKNPHHSGGWLRYQFSPMSTFYVTVRAMPFNDCFSKLSRPLMASNVDIIE